MPTLEAWLQERECRESRKGTASYPRSEAEWIIAVCENYSVVGIGCKE